MSIMAFVQKKKEEALEKRVSGYLSPASEASMEEDEVKKPSVSVKFIYFKEATKITLPAK